MPRCAVASCKAYVGGKQKDGDGKPLSFHRFPTDAEERNNWIIRCKRSDEFDPDTERVCSNHFLKTDLDPFCVSKLSLGLEVLRPVLKSGAVPTLNLPTTSSR